MVLFLYLVSGAAKITLGIPHRNIPRYGIWQCKIRDLQPLTTTVFHDVENGFAALLRRKPWSRA
jgi:hypothetical protein